MMTPSRFLRPQLLIVLISAALLPISGCSPSYYFKGRILIVNATREQMQALRLIVDGGFEMPLGATAPEQAWIKAIGANDSIGFRWKTENGVEQGATEPLADHMRRNTRGDWVIMILGAGSMRFERCGLPE